MDLGSVFRFPQYWHWHFIRYVVTHQTATLQRPPQMGHFIRLMLTHHHRATMALAEFALPGCSCVGI